MNQIAALRRTSARNDSRYDCYGFTRNGSCYDGYGSGRNDSRYRSRHCLLLLSIFSSLLLCLAATTPPLHAQPNILIIIADDVGIDALEMYGVGSDLPSTPNLDRLRSEGLLFANAWSYPTCTPTRAAIASGHYGGKTGIIRAPGTLDLSFRTIFELLAEEPAQPYSNAVIGKWHIGGGRATHPNRQGVGHYVGFITSGVEDYFDWERTENGESAQSTEYLTTHLTDAAIDWLDGRAEPWLLWVAHAAPHSPFHLPPDSLYTRSDTEGNQGRYYAMIESVDHEVGRLIDALPAAQRDSTVIIFIGDNGTPGNVMQRYPSGHGKSSLFQGGVHVPMIIAGAGVTRRGETETSLVSVVDLHATIAAIAGVEMGGGLYNSRSLLPTFTDAATASPPFSFVEFESDAGRVGHTIRDDRYKLIEYDDGEQLFYDLENDPFEEAELLAAGLDAGQRDRLAILEAEAEVRLTGWSCNDLIRNGDEEGIDCGGPCAPCISSVDDRSFAEAESLVPIVREDYILLDLPFYSGEVFEARVYDATGRLLLVRTIDQANPTVPTVGFDRGVYLVEVRSGGDVEGRGVVVR